MKKYVTFLLVLGVSCGSLFAQDYDPKKLLIKFKTTAEISFDLGSAIFSSESINQLNLNFGCVKVHQIGPKNHDPNFTFYVLQFLTEQNVGQLVEDYMATGTLEFVEPDYYAIAAGGQATIPNDQFFSRSWGLKNTGQSFVPGAIAGADVQMTEAWDVETGDVNVVLSTLDTGLKTDHPEFAGRLWVNAGEIPNNGLDDDNNGYVDDINGYNTIYDNEYVGDDVGHGTNVTGISAATGNNSIGYAGADWHCKVMTVKCLDSNNTGSFSAIIEALYYSVDNGADVVNMSLGGPSFSSAMNQAVIYASQNEVTIVAAMGNANNSVTSYPAGYSSVIAVGATNANDQRTAPFSWGGGSSYGSHISVCAPGNYIYGLSNTSNTNYNSYWSGTSQATPLVSGIATLLKAHDPSITPAEIKSLLELTADDQVGNPSEDTPGFDQYHGHGRVNAYAAFNSIGISEEELLRDLQIYPNPARDFLKLNWLQNRILKVELINTLGNVVYATELNSGISIIDLSQFPAGLYFLQIDRSAVKKVLIAR